MSKSSGKGELSNMWVVVVMIQDDNLFFSSIHLSLLSVDSPLTFTGSVMFFTNNYQYIIW